MKKLSVLFSMALLAVMGPAQGALITSVNGSDIITSFTSGTLSINDTIAMVVQYDNGTQYSFVDSHIQFSADLISDNSAGGVASGMFGNGSYSIFDSTNTLLLSGQVEELLLTGTAGGYLLGGYGSVTLDDGTLKSYLPSGAGSGDVVTITFQLIPGPVQDFSSDFTGRTNLSIHPIPEPATMILLGLGGMTLLRKKRS
jgi:hypothetical protein